MNKKLKELTKCPRCGKPLIPDKKAVIEGTKKWDKHTYMVGCDCAVMKKGVRISVG